MLCGGYQFTIMETRQWGPGEIMASTHIVTYMLHLALLKTLFSLSFKKLSANIFLSFTLYNVLLHIH